MLAATRPTALRALPLMAAAIMLLCAPGYAETLDELYAKAKDEKSLVIYAGGRCRTTSRWRGTSSAGFRA
jgi:hypothetical protein